MGPWRWGPMVRLQAQCGPEPSKLEVCGRFWFSDRSRERGRLGRLRAGGLGIWVGDVQVFDGQGRLLVMRPLACAVNQVMVGIDDAGRSICRDVTCAPGSAFRGFAADGSALCERDDQGIASIPVNTCGPGQAIVAIRADGTTVCGRPRAGDRVCPDGEVVSGYNADGSVICVAGGGGDVELPANACGPGQALVALRADGTSVCGRPRAGAQACADGAVVVGLAQDGSVLCRQDATGLGALPANTCGAGQALFRIAADGTTECRRLHSGQQACPNGQVATGIQPDGTLVCAVDAQGITQLPSRTCGPNQALFRIDAEGTPPAVKCTRVFGRVRRAKLRLESQRTVHSPALWTAKDSLHCARTCGQNQALFRINANGGTECRQLHGGQSACADERLPQASQRRVPWFVSRTMRDSRQFLPVPVVLARLCLESTPMALQPAAGSGLGKRPALRVRLQRVSMPMVRLSVPQTRWVWRACRPGNVAPIRRCFVSTPMATPPVVPCMVGLAPARLAKSRPACVPMVS